MTQELIYLLRQWSQADPDRCCESEDLIFVASCSDRTAAMWNASDKKMDDYTLMFFERALRESVRARKLQVSLSENYTDEGYKYRVSLCDMGTQSPIGERVPYKMPRCECSAGLKNSSFEAYLSSFVVFVNSTQPVQR